MNKPIIIGIDPDVDNNGVCILKDRKLDYTGNKTFPELVAMFRDLSVEETTVIVEAGYLIKKSNWHGAVNNRAAQRIAKNTGRNHQVAKMLVETARSFGLDVIEQRPYKKIWKGKEGKITHEEISSFIQGFPKSSNQDQRDAVLLCWYYANLPIRITA